MKARKRDAAQGPTETTPSPPVSARLVAAKRPLRACKPPLGADSAPLADPGNDTLPLDPRQACSGSKPGDAVVDLPVERTVSHVDADGRQWVASAGRPTADEVEAIAQRLAALFLRGA